MSRFQLSRRTMLRGLGASMALPLLDAMIPANVGAIARAAAGAVGGPVSATGAPLRMAMVFIPNGVNYQDWTPTGEGKGYELSNTLKPLADVKGDFSVLTGLALDGARAHNDGPGDHARSAAAFLTGAHPYKTAGRNIKIGISVDQVAAQKIGERTRLPSLELGLDKGAQAGGCDSGYACAYSNNVSWSSETTPVPKEVNPANVFDRLFGSASSDAAAREAREKRMKYRKSILDFVADDAKRLNAQLGTGDQHKLDEFQTSIREIEKRIEHAQKLAVAQQQNIKKPDNFPRPNEGRPDDIGEHFKLMWDLLALSFQMDVTRISTLMIAGDGSNRSYTNIGITEGHHSLSHHGGEKDKIEAIKKIDRYHMEQYGYFIKRLKGIKEGDGTLLDHCMVMLGGGIGDGNRHNHHDLPILLAGKGNGTITPGRHVKYSRDTPLCNLYLGMLERMGMSEKKFGDSTGTLGQLSA